MLKPNARIIQTVSNLDTFQFLTENNSIVMVFFTDKKLDQLAGDFGNTKIKSKPLNLAYKDQLCATIAETDLLQDLITGKVTDERWEGITYVVEI